MSRYFSEAMNHHPEFLRLNQRIRELEIMNEAYCEQIGEMTQQLSDAKFKLYTRGEKANKAEANLRIAEITIEAYKKEMERFNRLSIFYKMFYHFDIDKE